MSEPGAALRSGASDPAEAGDGTAKDEQDGPALRLVEPGESASFSGRSPGLFRRLYDYIVKLRGSPEQIAWGLVIGLFVSMTPTVGLQTFIAVPIAGFFRVNPASAALGVWLTNPLTIPFLYGLNYLIGASILGLSVEHDLGEGLSAASLMGAGHHAILALVVGGAITGAVVGLGSYYPTVYMIRAARLTARKARAATRAIRERAPGRAGRKADVDEG